jgi:acyl carrier protein
MSAEILKQIETILRRDCGVVGPITRGARLQQDLGLDSVGLLTLALEVENHFEIILAEPPDRPPETIAELIALVAEAQQGA